MNTSQQHQGKFHRIVKQVCGLGLWVPLRTLQCLLGQIWLATMSISSGGQELSTLSAWGSVNVLVQREWNRSTHLSPMPNHHIRQGGESFNPHPPSRPKIHSKDWSERHTGISLDFQELSSTWTVGSYQFPQCSHRPALRCPAHAFEAPGFAAAGTSLQYGWASLASCNFIPPYSDSFLQSLQCSMAEPSKVHTSSLASESLSAVANLQQSGKAEYP